MRVRNIGVPTEAIKDGRRSGGRFRGRWLRAADSDGKGCWYAGSVEGR